MNTRRYIQGIFSTAIFALTLVGFSGTARAQTTNLIVTVLAPTNAIPVNSTLTYSIFITNTLGLAAQNVYITNSLSPASVRIVGANNISNPSPGSIGTNGNDVTFFLFQIIGGDVAQLTLSVKPTVAGTVTNRITVFTTQLISNIVGTVLNEVTNIPGTSADLGVSISVPPVPVLVNDFLTYGVTVTNRGPGNATNVFLTNAIPGAVFRGTNQSVVNLGNISSGGFKLFNVQLQPTNSGTLTFTAALGGGNITDTNSANDFASTNVVVETALTNVLVATNLTPSMVFNPQNSLMEQTIRLVNVSATNDVASARVILAGLAATNRLYNAVGTNNGNPYVVYAAPLAPGESVDLLMQYVIPNRLPVPIDNTNYVALPTSAFSVSAPTNYTLAITNYVVLPSQAFLIEFPAIKGRTYTILYSSDFSTNTLAAQPPVTAQADKVQWIDDGPPKTISHPKDSPARFYRVLLNP